MPWWRRYASVRRWPTRTSCCAAWARSMSAAASSRSRARRCSMIVRQPGGPPTKLDPNGQYMVEQMYVQYFLPKNRKGKLPLLMWHGGGLTGVTYESTPDGREAGSTFSCARLGHLRLRRGRARPLRLCVAGRLDRRADLPDLQDPFERFRIGDGEARGMPTRRSRRCCPGSQFPVEAYANYMKQAVPRWLTTDERSSRLYRTGRQGLSLRAAGAQPGRHLRLQGRRAAARQDQGDRRGRVGDRRQRSPMRRS